VRLNRREQNKLDKLRRIKASSRELFLRKGYEEATMREIAQHAGVGLGTLFSYAADKRDLLFLIYNDELQRVTEAGFLDPGGSKSFLAKVIDAFSGYYEFFAREPEFMRQVLREILYYSTGPEAPRIRRGREIMVSGLIAIVADARARGQISSSAKDSVIAGVIFEIYQGEVRRWLMDFKPDPSEGVRRLRVALRLLCEGIT